MKENYLEVIEMARDFRDKAGLLLEGAPNIQLNMRSVVDRLIGGLTHVVGIDVESGNDKPKNVGQPLTRIAGRDLKPRVTAPDLALPSAAEFKKLLTEASEAYAQFQMMPAAALRETYSDTIIRRVAVMARMQVTPTEPKKINIPFIEQVIEAVKQQALQTQVNAEAMASAARSNGAQNDTTETTDEKTADAPQLGAPKADGDTEIAGTDKSKTAKK